MGLRRAASRTGLRRESRSVRQLGFLAGAVAVLATAVACGNPAASNPAPPGPQDPLPVTLGYSAKPTPTGNTKAFTLTVRRTPWELLPGVTVQAVTYNGTVPGPTIRVVEGDTVRIAVRNELDQDTSVHWHGVHVPFEMDGVVGINQPPIRPGETFTYEFRASHAGTFMYHPHVNSVAQIDSGLYGLLVIEPQRVDGVTAFDKEFSMMLGAWMVGMEAMPSEGGGMTMDYNYFTINGKAYPSVEPWTVKEGDTVRVRLVNISNLAHPMHLHGQDFKVIAKDGEPVAAANQQWMNTVTVNPGETYDIAFIADNPGVWVFHCHELHHTENEGVEPGGLVQVIRYEGSQSYNERAGVPTPTPMPPSMPGMRH